jgi:hypothetical protein
VEDEELWGGESAPTSRASAKEARSYTRQADALQSGPIADAYHAGEDGLGPSPHWGDDEMRAWRAGRDDSHTAAHRDAAPAPSSPSKPRTSQRPFSSFVPQGVRARKHQASSFVLGAIGAALFMAYWTYGPEGPKSWVAAKFWNSPTIKAGSPGSGSSGSGGSSSSGSSGSSSSPGSEFGQGVGDGFRWAQDASGWLYHTIGEL